MCCSACTDEHDRTRLLAVAIPVDPELAVHESALHPLFQRLKHVVARGHRHNGCLYVVHGVHGDKRYMGRGALLGATGCA